MARLGRGSFVKYEALGNDYLLVDGARFGASAAAGWGPLAAAMCRRHHGVGGDGLLVRLPPPRGDGAAAALRIFNPDGSEAEKSGNGLRIFGRALFDLGYTAARRMEVLLGAERVALRLLPAAGGRPGAVRVAMGRARFDSAAVGLRGPPRQVLDEPLVVAGETLRIAAVSLGNPHCVVFVGGLDEARLRHVGPRLERHPDFTRRTNVQLAHVRSRSRIDVLVWERGAGETQASGSSACAVAAAAYRRGLVDGALTVCMPGGTLALTVTARLEVSQTGPATPVCRGLWLPPLPVAAPTARGSRRRAPGAPARRPARR